MAIGNWDEIRTAFHVARAGTVSGAAETLGVHHATVIRHIDALEAALGVKLFQRHPRGYTPTEAGQDLFVVAQTAEDQFGQLMGRLKGQGSAVTGELVVTSLPNMSHVLAPALTEFQRDHPGVIVRFLTDERLFRLEYGEAHVAIRGGSPPEEPDNVVQRYLCARYSIYASQSYLEEMGRPETDEDLARHRFVAPDDPAIRWSSYRWLTATLPPEVRTFRVRDGQAAVAAVKAGAGLAFLSQLEAPFHPELVEVMPSRREWESQFWLVTHVDLHRTAKVQAVLKVLKAAVQEFV